MKYLVAILSIVTLMFVPSVWSEGTKANVPHSDDEELHDHGGHAEPVKKEEPDHHKNEHGHAEDEGHEKEVEHGPGEAGHKDHDEDHEHEEGGEEHEEGGSNVGPDKGILEASEKNGIKLSPQALKNFDIKTQKISDPPPWTIPDSARLFSGEEINLYRVRDGFFKRIDFSLIKRVPNQIVVDSSELKSGDEIVVNGIGFVRIAEIAAFGGAPEGHSH